MKNIKKVRTETYLNEYKKLINYYHSKDCLVIFTDGSANNMKQSKPIKFGFLIYEKGKVIHKDSQVCKDTFNTSVKSELMAINAALGFLVSENITNEDIVIFSDNKFIVEWCINKPKWYSTSKEKAYYESFIMLRSLMNKFPKIESFWIPREVNEEADKLTRN